MGTEVVELSSDSDVSILSNEFISHRDANTKRSTSVRTKSSVRAVKRTRVLSLKASGTLPVEEVRRLVKEVEVDKVKVRDLQAYARAQGLIIGGSKSVLFDRVKKHIEIFEGVETYEPETFTINVTGDVCVGDVVRFKQRVYDSYNLFQKDLIPAGMRTVVGRVLNDSYGEKTKQHTFTIEVLWSSGYKALAPMKKLLIKGRNLYMFGVHRQPWEDERMRLTVLEEKHERGAIARALRRRKRLAGATIGKKRKRENPEMPSEGVCASKTDRGSAAGSNKQKKMKHVPNLALTGACETSRPQHSSLIIQSVAWKRIMKLRAKKCLLQKHSAQGSAGIVETEVIRKTKAARRKEKKARKALLREKNEQTLAGCTEMTKKSKAALRKEKMRAAELSALKDLKKGIRIFGLGVRKRRTLGQRCNLRKRKEGDNGQPKNTN